MIYKTATIRDLEYIIQMKNEVKQRIIQKNLPIWLEDYPTDDLIKEDIEHGFGRIILEDQEIVGYASLYPAISDYPSQTFSEEDLFSFGRVMVKYEGRHFASYLVDSMIEEIRKMKKRGIGILVDACNEAAVRLYKKYGFSKIGERQFPYAYLDIYELLFS